MAKASGDKGPVLRIHAVTELRNIMNKIVSILIIPLLITGSAWEASASSRGPLNLQRNGNAPEETKFKNLKVQAGQLTDAVLRADYERAADLTFPKLIELMGGRQRFISVMETGMKEVQSEQFRITSITVGEPRGVVEAESQIYAIVPTTMRIKVREGILVGEAFMIGVSKDGGKNWTFVDSGGRSMDKSKLKILFPAAADKLRIPEIKRPVLYRESSP